MRRPSSHYEALIEVLVCFDRCLSSLTAPDVMLSQVTAHVAAERFLGEQMGSRVRSRRVDLRFFGVAWKQCLIKALTRIDPND